MSDSLWLWESMCVALFWSVFCRSVRASETTKFDVRVALWLVGMASLLGIAAPLYGWHPDTVVMLIVLAVVVMQVVMSRHWDIGVPWHFVKQEYKPRRRMEDRK
jgi:hypothetical protein